MKTLLAAAAAVAFATPASAGIMVVAGAPMNFTVIEHAKTDATAAIGKEKDNRGDVLTFANPVFDRTNTRQVGTDNGFCIRTVVGKAYECIWTLKLAQGQITVEGPFLDSGDTRLAITGGTGKFLDARGEMVLHARDARGSEYDFKYSLVR